MQNFSCKNDSQSFRGLIYDFPSFIIYRNFQQWPQGGITHHNIKPEAKRAHIYEFIVLL